MWVIKIGGRLLDAGKPPVEKLIRALARISQVEPTTVLTGGGMYADCIRSLDRKYAIGAPGSHLAAVLAMHMNAYRLASRSPDLFAITDHIGRAPRSKIPILLPLDMVRRSNLPQSWDVTSDSIAAYVAYESRAHLAIVKTVDGVLDPYPSGRLVKEISPRVLSRLRSSPVDRFLPTFLSIHQMDAWLVNGLHPRRLESIVKGEGTICTHIRP